MSDNLNILTVGKNARTAALGLSEISDQVIGESLVLFSSLIQKNRAKILEANKEDVKLAIFNNSNKVSSYVAANASVIHFKYFFIRTQNKI